MGTQLYFYLTETNMTKIILILSIIFVMTITGSYCAPLEADSASDNYRPKRQVGAPNEVPTSDDKDDISAENHQDTNSQVTKEENLCKGQPAFCCISSILSFKFGECEPN